MPWLHHSKVSPVQGRKLGLTEALDDCEDGCVYEADIHAGILINQFRHPHVILEFESFDSVDTSDDVEHKEAQMLRP